MLPRSSLARRLRRSVLARRRPLAAVCAAVAVAAALRANAAPPPARTLVVTAAHDVAAGQVLGPGALSRSRYDPAPVPDGVLAERAALGRTTAGALRRGEPVTDVRLVGGHLLAGRPALVAVPVRIGDAGAVGLLRPGDRIDLLAADPQGRSAARLVGSDVLVLAVPRPAGGGTSVVETPGLTNGGLVVLGLPDADAGRVAQASVTSFLTVVLRR